MITEKEAQELVSKLKDLKDKSSKDPSFKSELKQHEQICVSKLKYLITMKMNRYKNFSNYEDLVQEGYEALLKAIKTYNPSRGSVFWWCHKYIDTRISRSANLHTTIRYPLKVAKEQTPHKENIMPNIVDEYNCPERHYEMMQAFKLVENGLDFLNERQKTIINMAFGLEDTKPFSINKIAKQTNLSRSVVLKEYKSALNVLKEHIKH